MVFSSPRKPLRTSSMPKKPSGGGPRSYPYPKPPPKKRKVAQMSIPAAPKKPVAKKPARKTQPSRATRATRRRMG
jgi:hypothetical protein